MRRLIFVTPREPLKTNALLQSDHPCIHMFYICATLDGKLLANLNAVKELRHSCLNFTQYLSDVDQFASK